MSVHLQTNITSFSNDDGDGSKHVTMNTNSNLYIVDAFIPTRFKCWSLIQSSKRGGKCLRVFTFSIKRRIRNFTSYSCSYGKEMNKKACSTSEIVVCLLDLLLLIVTFCCRRGRPCYSFLLVVRPRDCRAAKNGNVATYSSTVSP